MQFIDDFTDPNSRDVYLVVSNVKLNEITNQIIKSGSNQNAEFELQPRLNWYQSIIYPKYRQQIEWWKRN